MIFPAGYWVILECFAKSVSLAGRKFHLGERIAVKLRKDLQTDGKEDRGGAWGWGRYSHRHVYAMAAQIEDLRSCEIIWEAETEGVELVTAVLL